ncbi:MAG: Ig-like domain-containing protein [Acidobacteriota bacterium]
MKHSHLKIASIGISVLISLLFASFASAQTSPSGLLWVYKDDPDPSMSRASVVVINRATNIELKRFRPGATWEGGGCIFGRGVAYDPRDGNLWVAMNRGSCSTPSGGTFGDGLIHKINSWDGSDIGAIPDPTNFDPTGTGFGGSPSSLGAMDYDAQDNALYGVSFGAVCYALNTNCHSWVYKLNADTGAVLWKTELAPGINNSHTLAVERDQNGRKVLRVNRGYLDTGTGEIIQSPGGSFGLAGIDVDEITGQEVQALVSAVDISVQDGRCDCETIPRPPTQNVSSAWPFDLAGTDPNWSMLVQVTDNDGLVLRDIKLGQRYMAQRISVPYYYLETTTFPRQRGELKPDGADASKRSRLVNYYTTTDDEKLVIEATYIIDQIPAGSPSCLHITQRYEFYRSRPGDQCEPSGTLPCARWKPMIKYQFVGRNGEFLKSLNIAQRQHRIVDNNSYNTVGLFKDCDFPGTCRPTGGGIVGSFGFERKFNPLFVEWYDRAINGGKTTKQWDNIHQTYLGSIEEPGICPTCPGSLFVGAGCPECVHNHWRWGAIQGQAFGNGNILGMPVGSTQDLDFAVIRYQSGEEDPNDLKDLVQLSHLIRTYDTSARNPLQIYRASAPEEVVVWHSAMGHQNSDTFFAYGGFFNPALPSQQLYGGSSSVVHPSSADASKLGSAETVVMSSEDGISSVVATQIYANGSTNITPFDVGLAGPLPTGYSQYSSLSYDVTTTAEASGPNTITFSVQSVTDQNMFDGLRIFHLEQDPYDPSAAVWIDRTVLAPDPQAPDFANKIINAKANSLGQFVVASLTQPQPPNTGIADITVTSSDSPDGVVVGNDLTYTITVTNNGPQNATGVVFSNALSPQTEFLSVNSSQGNCSEVEGTVVCKLETIAAGSGAIVTILVNPVDGSVPLPAQGTTISDTSFAKANETDPNTNNNLATENTTLLPDGNARPTINITSPTQGGLFVGPANVNVSATAGDSDGSVAKVEFYGDGNLIGTGTLTAPSQYSLVWNNVAFGRHSLIAVATDNLNKTALSDPVTIAVNGSAIVNMTTPANDSAFSRPANITVTANASVSGGTISKVDFYADGFILLGTGTLSGPDQYSITWNAAPSGRHVLTAIATDSSNVTTTSMPVNVTVNDPPVISLVAPAGGTVFSPAPASITLTANASDGDGSVTRVDFYANGSLIGTNSSPGVNRFNLSWSNVAAGNYSVIAVATDNHFATKTSTPITVRVNAAPTVGIVAPSNGAQFTAPANITLTANAADIDGSVSKVDFFANGYRIGGGAAIGGGQYSFSWSGVGIGSYAFTATATDNEGATASSGGPTVTVTSPVLFVTGSTTLNSTDTAVKTRLEVLNHTVTVKSAASAVTADATGKALVVISSTVTPTSVGTKFRTVAVPVLTWESGIYNNMGMTGSTNKDFGTKTNSTQVSVTNPTHPLAAGFSGNTTVASSGTFNWGKPNANAVSVAIVVGDTSKTLIFGYDAGGVMPGLTAPARRVAFFMHDATVLNSNGTALLDAAIKWARGGGSIAGSILLSPTGPVDLTAEGVFDWAHWGLNGPSAFNHKGSVTQQITNFTLIGTGALGWFLDGATTFSWTDGTPTLSASSTQTGVNTNGVVGNGFEINMPADTNLKSLKLYVGAWYAQGKLEATVSDGSAPAFINTALNNNAGGTFGLYTINYKAGSPGQTLKVRYTILNQYFAPNGNIALKAAMLQ